MHAITSTESLRGAIYDGVWSTQVAQKQESENNPIGIASTSKKSGLIPKVRASTQSSRAVSDPVPGPDKQVNPFFNGNSGLRPFLTVDSLNESLHLRTERRTSQLALQPSDRLFLGGVHSLQRFQSIHDGLRVRCLQC